MKATAEPTIFLVPGALQSSACYNRLRPILQDAGFPTVVGSLTSLNPSVPEDCTAAKDGRHLLDQYLLPLIREGKDVVVFAHSFGATCLSGAGQKLSKSERTKADLSGGVIGLVYSSFVTAPDGFSQFGVLDNIYPPFTKPNYPRRGLVEFTSIRETLFNDVDDANAAEFAKVTGPHSMNAIETPVSGPLWQDPNLDHRRVAIKTMLDATFNPALQDLFISNSGVNWNVVELEAGHESFLTQPEAVAKIIIDAVRSWM